MDHLRNGVRIARRRLAVQCFVTVVPWCLFGTLGIASVVLLAGKFLTPGFASAAWTWGWLGGSVAAGLAAAGLWTWYHMDSDLGSALEVDLRCHLHERVSSALALSPEQQATQAGQALLADADRALRRADLPSRFQVSVDRMVLLPLVPAVLAVGILLFVPDRERSAAAEADTADTQRLKTSAQVLTKELEGRRKRAEQRGLKDAQRLFHKLEDGVRELAGQKNIDHKKALIELNDLARQLDQRRAKLGGDAAIGKQLNQLKKPSQGPAERLAKALKQGDFAQAGNEIQSLAQRIRDGKMDGQTKTRLSEQLQQIQKAMRELSDAHRQSVEALKQQIARARQAGRSEDAAKLQQRLSELQRQLPQTGQMDGLASRLEAVAAQLHKGNDGQALDALTDAALQLERLQQNLEELALLDDALNQIAQCKTAMGCLQCQGAGCRACQGSGGSGDGSGDGLGQGQSRGARPEQQNDGSFYDSRVGQKPGPGSAVIKDFVEGPNARGQIQQRIRAEMQSAERLESDPMADRRLPRAHRQHAREYFERFREGR